MLTLCFIALGILVIVFETTLIQSLPSWIGRPDFVFILVAFAAYRFAWLPGLVLTFILSWIIDSLTGITLGVYPLVCLTVFASLKALTTNNPLRESMYQIPLVGISFFLVQLVTYFLYSFTLPDFLPEWSWGRVFGETGILVVATIPCFLLLNAFCEYLERRKLQPRNLRRKP